MFGFDKTKVTNGKLYGELRLVLKYNFKEREWIFRLHRQIWSCGICRLKFSTYWVKLTTAKTGYNIRKSKSELHLHSFREVYLGNKQLSGSNKLTVSRKKYQKWVVFCEVTIVKLVAIFLKKYLWTSLPRRIL